MTDNALKIIKDELARIENDRHALVEMGSESKTKAKVFLLAKALSVAVDQLDRITDLHCDDGPVMQMRSYECIQSIANILSGGKDGK